MAPVSAGGTCADFGLGGAEVLGDGVGLAGLEQGLADARLGVGGVDADLF